MSDFRGWVQHWSALLNHDFCPWANRWMDWLKNPCWVLTLVTAASFLCGLFVNANLLWVTAGLSGLIALGLGWPWLTLCGVSGRVQFASRRGRVGEPTKVWLSLWNRWPWPAWGIVLSRGFEPVRAARGGLAISRLRSFGGEEFLWWFEPPARGRYPCETPRLECSFPFGLWTARRTLDVSGELLVWPQSTGLSVSPESAGDGTDPQQVADRRAGDFGDLLGTRCFRQGDSLRRVHWSQSARLQRLIVTERQASAVCEVAVTLDWIAGVSGVAVDAPSREQVLRIGASVCESLHRQHAHVECLLENQRFTVGARPDDLRRLLDAMARVPNDSADEELAGSLATPNTRRRRGVQIVVTTEAGWHLRWSRAADAHGTRVILVSDASSREEAWRGSGGRSRQPWITVAAHDDLPKFALSWRRACLGQSARVA